MLRRQDCSRSIGSIIVDGSFTAISYTPKCRPIKRDINHSAREDRALVCMRRERKRDLAILRQLPMCVRLLMHTRVQCKITGSIMPSIAGDSTEDHVSRFLWRIFMLRTTCLSILLLNSVEASSTIEFGQKANHK